MRRGNSSFKARGAVQLTNISNIQLCSIKNNTGGRQRLTVPDIDGMHRSRIKNGASLVIKNLSFPSGLTTELLGAEEMSWCKIKALTEHTQSAFQDFGCRGLRE
jgi:hypothetical protein